MTVTVTEAQVRKLAPKAIPEYLQTFMEGAPVLARYAIDANPRRLTHFMAQVLHECGRLTIREESLNYNFKGLTGTFGAHRITPERAQEICRLDNRVADQEAIANCVYGGDWGKKNLGNTDPGDGWKYRGRGLIQITGRNNYTKRGQLLGIDLAAQPELVVDPRYALEIAAAFWHSAGCNEIADRSDDAKAVTKAVNGGAVGLDEREELLGITRQTWPWA